MSLPLPYGNPEVVSELDVEIYLRDEVIPLIAEMPEPETDVPRQVEVRSDFGLGYLDLILTEAIEEYVGDDFAMSVDVVERDVVLEIGVRTPVPEHAYFKYTYLLEEPRPNGAHAERIRSNELWFYRFFYIKFDPDEGLVIYTDRRAGFYSPTEREDYDITIPETSERDDSRVYEDEFALIKYAVAYSKQITSQKDSPIRTTTDE